MRAIRILCDEHAALREVLSDLELVLDAQLDDDRLEADLALDALEWLERFADGLHQDREEMAIFPCLARRAGSDASHLIDELNAWHAEERRRLDEMRARIEGAAYGDPLSRDSFTVAARAYIDLQRRHADIEDERLVPLARSMLTAADDRVLLREYARLERRHTRPGEARPEERVRDLSARVGRRMFERRAGRTLIPRPRGSTPLPAPHLQDVA